jgi:hypothetical protein
VPVERTEQALPGFELEVATRAEQDMADIGADIKDKVFTGEMLRLRYPGKYALAARAFFEKNRSAESICDILRISPQTMHALVETECAARGFSSVKARIRAKSASVALRTVSELQKLLDNPEAVRKAGIVGLTNALKALTGNEDGNQEGEKPKKSSSDDNSAADEFIDVYESTDGFWGEKNPARGVGESAVGETDGQANGPAEPGASTGVEGGAEPDRQTLVESASSADLKGFPSCVAKSADNLAADSRGNAVASCAGAPRAHAPAPDAPPHPGGGAPAPARAGV